MGKLLSWIFLIALGYVALRLAVLFKRKSAALRRQTGGAAAGGQPVGGQPGGGPGGPDERDPQAPAKAGERMIACAHCGVYAPESDLFAARGRHYCSAAHRDADAL